MKALALLVSALLCLSASSAAKDYYDDTRDAKKIAWMDLGMKLVRAKLKDPSSAQFRNVYFNYSLMPATCGEVNSKNSFGAFSGFQRFISTGKTGVTVLEEDLSDFNSLWQKVCK